MIFNISNNKQILKLYQVCFEEKEMNDAKKLEILNKNVHENLFYSVTPEKKLALNFKKQAFRYNKNYNIICNLNNIDFENFSFPKKYITISNEDNDEKLQKEIDNREREISRYFKEINEAFRKKNSIEENAPLATNFIANFPMVKSNNFDDFENFSFQTKSKSIISNIPNLNNHILEKIGNEDNKNNIKFNDDDFYEILDKKKGIRLFERKESQERLCEICENLKDRLNQHFKKMDSNDFSLLKKSVEKNQKSDTPLNVDEIFDIYDKFTNEYEQKNAGLSKSIDMYEKNRDISAKLLGELVLEKSLRTIKKYEENNVKKTTIIKFEPKTEKNMFSNLIAERQ